MQEVDFPDGALAVTVDELAGMLRISRSWIYKQAAADAIPCVRFGNSLRFTRQNVAQILGQRSEKKQPPTPPSRVKAIPKLSRP